MNKPDALLRPFASGDVDLVLAWRNAPDVRKNMYSTHEISPEEHQRWFDETLRSDRRRYYICEIDKQPAGVVGFYNIDRENRTAEWAFYSGDVSRRGAGSVMEWLALETAFGELNLFKLNCEVLSSNFPVVAFHRKFGFRMEGRFQAEKNRGEQREDVYRLGMFAHEWNKYLRAFNEQRLFGDKESIRWLPGQAYRKKLTFTDSMIRSFADLSGDRNPLHVDERYAKQAGFPSVIAHGALVGAKISEVLGMEFPGAGTVYICQDSKFLAPCIAGVEYELELVIASVIGNRAFLEVKVSAGGKINLEGEAEVRLPR